MSENKTKTTSTLKIILIALAVMFAFGIFCISIMIAAIMFFLPKDLGVDQISNAITSQMTSDITESSYDHPLLSEDQEILLESMGIETSTLPTEVSQEQMDCGVEALGQERADEIINGATPNLSDLVKAQHCF